MKLKLNELDFYKGLYDMYKALYKRTDKKKRHVDVKEISEMHIVQIRDFPGGVYLFAMSIMKNIITELAKLKKKETLKPRFATGGIVNPDNYDSGDFKIESYNSGRFINPGEWDIDSKPLTKKEIKAQGGIVYQPTFISEIVNIDQKALDRLGKRINRDVKKTKMQTL